MRGATRADAKTMRDGGAAPPSRVCTPLPPPAAAPPTVVPARSLAAAAMARRQRHDTQRGQRQAGGFRHLRDGGALDEADAAAALDEVEGVAEHRPAAALEVPLD